MTPEERAGYVAAMSLNALSDILTPDRITDLEAGRIVDTIGDFAEKAIKDATEEANAEISRLHSVIVQLESRTHPTYNKELLKAKDELIEELVENAKIEVATERGACAKVAENWNTGKFRSPIGVSVYNASQGIAQAIRGRE